MPALIDELFFVIRTNPDPSGTAVIFGIYENHARADDNILEFNKDPATSGLYEVAVMGSGLSGPASSGNTLGAAYNQGGAGAGSIITADTGAVQIFGSNNSALILGQTSNGQDTLVVSHNATGGGHGIRLIYDGSQDAINILNGSISTLSKSLDIVNASTAGQLGRLTQTANNICLEVRKNSIGIGDCFQAINAGIGKCAYIEQAISGIALEINHFNTGPLLNLISQAGNPRGDISFSKTRTSDPSNPDESDVWYNTTDKNLYLFDGSSNVDLTQQNTDNNTQNKLGEAYNEGGAGAGRVITAGAGAVQIDGQTPSHVIR